MIITLASLSLQTFAETDLKTKYDYCVKERDQAEETLDLCDLTLTDCEASKAILTLQIDKQKEIIDSQTKEIEARNLKEMQAERSKTTTKIVFAGLGIVLGSLIALPIYLIFLK